MTPKFPRDFRPTVLKPKPQSSSLRLRDYHTLWSAVPGKFDFTGSHCIRFGLITPHLPCLSAGIQFKLYRFHSPLLAASQLISLPAPTKMFQSGAFPILTDQHRSAKRSH